MQSNGKRSSPFGKLAPKLGHKLFAKWCPSPLLSLAPQTIKGRNERWKIPGSPPPDLMRPTDGWLALIPFFTLTGLNIHLSHRSDDGTLMIMTISPLKHSAVIVSQPAQDSSVQATAASCTTVKTTFLGGSPLVQETPLTQNTTDAC